MTTIPAVFQKAIEAYEESERERLFGERQKNIERAEILTRELRTLGLDVPGGLKTPWVAIEGIVFTLIGNRTDGFNMNAHVYNFKGELYWARVYSLSGLGELLKEHYEIVSSKRIEAVYAGETE